MRFPHEQITRIDLYVKLCNKLLNTFGIFDQWKEVENFKMGYYTANIIWIDHMTVELISQTNIVSINIARLHK